MSRYQLLVVPQGASSLEVLAERYRRAFDKTTAGRELWIEGTLELAVIVAEARTRMPDHHEYSRWLARHGLQSVSNNDRTALTAFAKDLEAARKLLEKSDSRSWRVIWENRPRRALIETDRGPLRPVSRRSGSSKRKRKQRVPDVMQEPPPASPPLPPPRRRLSDMGLTPEQVDPDFKGTALEFATKYGHVNLSTKDQIEYNKRQETLAVWLRTLQEFERAGRMMLGALSGVEVATINEWKGKNGKAEKLRTWCDSVEIACDALRKL